MDNYEQAIKGVEFASKILQIRTPEVRFFTNEEINNRGVNALYKDQDNIISFNEQWLKIVNNIEVQVACFHESRHAFQYEVVNEIYRGDLQIDLKTTELWKREYSNYKSILNRNENEYLIQDI